MMANLTKLVIDNGGDIFPLIIPTEQTGGTGLMNPSIYNDDGKLICNLRHVNYTLMHCEGQQIFGNRHGPLAYLNPENDIKLKTINFMLELTDTLDIKRYTKIDTSKCDVDPLWEFHGLEDARLLRWDNDLWISGVRRDTTHNGQGRMELSKLDKDYKETDRYRIEAPIDTGSYCEKNWMVVEDLPFHYVKWANPTEVVKANIETLQSEQVVLKQGVGEFQNMRGSSQIVRWGDYRICIIHETALWKNKLDQRNAKYTHKFIVWDLDWNIQHISNPFSFMDGEIEFCCGLAFHNGDMLISFAFQDNAAFILRVPQLQIKSIVGMPDDNAFSFGMMDAELKDIIQREIFRDKVYEKYAEVKAGDVVVDIGANVGAFTYSILDKKPAKVYCIEPSNNLIHTLKSNTKNECVYVNKAIADKDGTATCNNEVHIYNHADFEYETISFANFIKEFDIQKIDFMKIDCEGGEYDVFTKENWQWIKTNVSNIAGELHLWGTHDSLNNFIRFRDTILTDVNEYHILNAHTLENITNEIWDNEWCKNYSWNNEHSAQFLFYIKNN